MLVAFLLYNDGIGTTSDCVGVRHQLASIACQIERS